MWGLLADQAPTMRLVAAGLLLSLLLGGFDSPVGADEAPVFSRDIQPLLAKHCVICHGPDQAEAGLRLDVAEQAQAELASGKRAIMPGKPDASELIRRVTTTDELVRMPPEGEPLSANEVSLLRRWIANGAKYETHWAYQPVTQPALPRVKDKAWVRNPIDRFVLARLERRAVAPSPQADRATLIRRLYYDLIGLPPTPEQVDAFVTDTSPGAYEAVVDRLLMSEHFGERWGRHWLDKARYADSDGYEKDRPRPNAWRYRDWVIDAINRDLPFDRFTIEQLAGDLLPDPSAEQKLATAFHRQTLTNTEGGTDQEEFRVEATFDRIETTSAVWMALTMTCARCHSHKYDQISHQEYYQLFAFFNNADEATAEVARSEEAMARYRRQKQSHDRKLAALTEQYDSAEQKLQPQIDRWARNMSAKMASDAEDAVQFHSPRRLEAKTSSEANLVEQQDGSLRVSGPVPDKDKYTLVFELPEEPLTGVRLEVLADDSLASNGPGRADNGNFVLSELRAYVSDDRDFENRTRIEFSGARADVSQDNFAPEGALSTKARSGWAIAPQMGHDHHLTLYTPSPQEPNGHKYLQVVLDQQYGGKHTIGRFRVTTAAGFDPLRALPKPVAAALESDPTKRSAEQQRTIAEHVASRHPETAKLATEFDELQEQAPEPPVMSVRVMEPAKRTTKILRRGDFLQPTEEVRSDALAVVTRTHPLKSRNPKSPADRLDLARWLVDPSHPLTPRVAVNQVWAHLFGEGIVRTLNDFGVRGEQPTHPKLLDWLAWNFPRKMRWSRKALIKTIVMSATWRQASRHRPELQTTDPANRLLARQNRVRVEAEVIRDLQLAVSGLLSRKVGGPSVFPPLPPGVAALSYAGNFEWKTSQGQDAHRRGMYTFFKRTSPHPTLTSFDCPDSNTTQLQRKTSNTPLQALTTLNNDVFIEAAQAFARRVLTQGGHDDHHRLTYALQWCTGRSPTTDEVNRFQELLAAARDHYQSHPEQAKQLTRRHAASGIAAEENAAWVATLRIVLNLDEFIVRD